MNYQTLIIVLCVLTVVAALIANWACGPRTVPAVISLLIRGPVPVALVVLLIGIVVVGLIVLSI